MEVHHCFRTVVLAWHLVVVQVEVRLVPQKGFRLPNLRLCPLVLGQFLQKEVHRCFQMVALMWHLVAVHVDAMVALRKEFRFPRFRLDPVALTQSQNPVILVLVG